MVVKRGKKLKLAVDKAIPTVKQISKGAMFFLLTIEEISIYFYVDILYKLMQIF